MKLLHPTVWYRERLEIKQQREIALWEKQMKNLEAFSLLPGHEDQTERLDISSRLAEATKKLTYVGSKDYLDSLVGTIGADPPLLLHEQKVAVTQKV